MNRKYLFNDGWEFAKSCLVATNCEALQFQPVDLPHDWLIYDTLQLYEDSIGWYRKRYYVNDMEDNRFLLYFEGVYMDSTLYVNGTAVGEWKYGYSSFEHDITEALREGENEILMKVVHQSPNSRWYSGAGIYRNVWIKIRGRNHIISDGIYVSTRKTDEGYRVEIDTELNIAEEAELSHTIYSDDRIVAEDGHIVTADNDTVLDRQILTVTNPELWSTENPKLYRLVTALRTVGSVEKTDRTKAPVEAVTQNIGFRELRLDSEQGFFLNGRRMKLNGVCEHHDLGALGAAFHKEALRRRFLILKEMGVNAIRTAHNMPAPGLMELADEMGFLVLSEAFDMWERPKTPNDYARFFKEWAKKDVRSWILRDRNHPSLLMWSIGNEIYDTHADERGQEVTRMLLEYVKEYDPKRNAFVTIGSNYMPWENAQKCADILKIAGYNYAEKYYQKHHEVHPDWVIFGSETASTVQSRGIYRFPFERTVLSDDDEQCSSLGNSSTSWGADSTEACIMDDKYTPFSLGQFIWTGFDYIGEPTPYHTKNSYFGQIDTATFKKDTFYLYQAAWTDYRTAPMVHIFPYWDFNPGQRIDVRVCSNAPVVELLLNGIIIGRKEFDHEYGRELAGCFQIPYEEGKLTAIAYDESGRRIATETRSSFGDAAVICLKPDKLELKADGRDLIFVEVSLEDEKGYPVENANNRVEVKVTGAGRLVGLDNGDSTDYDQYKGTCRRLFSGKLMAIIAATKETGKIRFSVSSQGLGSRELEFKAVSSDTEDTAGVSCLIRNLECPIIMGKADEIPLRKLELTSLQGNELSAALREVTVTAGLYPANTSYREVEWSVVNDAGILSHIASVEAAGTRARVTAIGDGEFFIRCTGKNGTDKTKLISQLNMKASGLGVAYKDPYHFITAGLYDYSRGEIGTGNEKGVATSRDGEALFGFRNIDFGPYGSDEITIPVFALSNDPYAIQIWEGIPGEEGSTMLAEVIYQKESIWNVYQEETYHLKKRLRGITSLSFVLRQKVHIKGFYFQKKNRAFEQNYAAEGDHIYGDTYTIHPPYVEGIGNNVSLEYDAMAFSGEGATRLVVYGRSLIDRNSIQIRFTGAEGEISQMIEFTRSEDYIEQSFELKRVTGVCRVTFLFLPGSRFDFGWFRFE
jgi:beta-galactosidase